MPLAHHALKRLPLISAVVLVVVIGFLLWQRENRPPEPEIVELQEQAVIESLGLSPQVAFTLAFSAKEAFYKCWYPITKSFFEFKQVAIQSCTADSLRIASLESNPNGKTSPAWLDVHFLATDSDVFTATWMEQTV